MQCDFFRPFGHKINYNAVDKRVLKIIIHRTLFQYIHSATNKFGDWPWKTPLEQDVWIFFDFFIQNILLHFQYTYYNESTVIQIRVLAHFVEMPLVLVL